jgi:hypothetical protein
MLVIFNGYEIKQIRPDLYEFHHPEYDGAPETVYGPPLDHRFGTGSSLDDAMEQIRDQIEHYDLDSDGNYQR